MLFTEPVFWFLFLPLLLSLHFLVVRPQRNLLLLLASLLFYAWGERSFVFVMLASIAFNYVVGLWIDTRRGVRSRERRWPLAVGVAGNLLLLAAYKYANVLADQLSAVFVALGLPGLELEPIHLPIGISFFTFQGMSYVIDIHRGETPVQRHPLRLALYISMFPQLIAGPIVRYGRIATQLVERTIDRRGFADGVRRFTVGLGKKVLIANSVALPADTIFALPPDQLTTAAAWLGIVCYTLQIYFDFSGYSDMAIGLGRMFGFRFPENFNYPYVAESVTEFWRRWHMTLSNWFRDYLYLPLGGNRLGRVRLAANLFTVFFLCGLWHGASWTFVVWGLYHGVLLSLERRRVGRAGGLGAVSLRVCGSRRRVPGLDGRIRRQRLRDGLGPECAGLSGHRRGMPGLRPDHAGAVRVPAGGLRTFDGCCPRVARRR
jgi:alginate O-acetyltransferase complex protein AlgI